MSSVFNRRSVREFDLTKKISYETLVELCKAAEAAPSARNQQGREYIIIDDKKIIDELSLTSKGSMVLSKCNTAIAVLGKDPKTLSTPHMQIQDLSCAVENILIEATNQKIASCYIGVYPLEERMKLCNDTLKVSNNAFTFALVALGYPKEDSVFYDKQKWSDELLHHNRY